MVVFRLGPRSVRISTVVASAAIAVASAVAPAGAFDEAEVGQVWRPPEAAGAPFVAERARTVLVLERADLRRRLDTITEAMAVLGPDAPGFTHEALLGEAETLESELEALELSHLAEATDEWNIDIGIFPVDELRKMFYDDWGEPRSGGRRHAGNDTLAHIGVPLRAIEDSTVQLLTNSRLGGRSIYLLGESGARYYYAHLDEVFPFEEGDVVYAGEQVGTVGDTGNARGAPHLHLQWSPTGDSNWENPYPLLAALFGELEPPSPGAFGPPNARRG